MKAVWERTGDRLGDFVRLIYLLEEALERLGAPKDGTLGEKVNSPALRGFLELAPDGPALREKLQRLVQIRNRIIHEREEVPDWAFSEGGYAVARLLQALALQGFYRPKELEARLQALRASPPPPRAMPTPIDPLEAKRPPRPEGRPSLPHPRRGLLLRRLALPRRR